MKKFYLIILLLPLLLQSCKNETRIREHNPVSEISQVLSNPKAKTLYAVSHQAIKMGDYNSARKCLQKSLTYEESPIIYNEIGVTFMAQKRFDEAINNYQTSIQIDSTYYPSYINLSRCHLILNQYDDGKKLLIKMISNCQSEYWKAYGNMYLALFYFNGDKDCKKAKLTLEKASRLRTDSDLGKQYFDFMDNIERTCR